MKPHHLLVLVLLAPKDGAAIFITGSAGESITIKCTIDVYIDLGATFMFCRESCKGEHILISTDNPERHGRYSLTITESFSKVTMKITIRSLRSSDSGIYRCGLKRRVLSDEFKTVTISVSDPVTTPRGADQEPSSPPGPTAPPPPSSWAPTFTAPSSERGRPTNRPRPPSPSGALISGGVASALLAALLLAALILCWRRSRVAPGSGKPIDTVAEAAEETGGVTYSQLDFASSGRGSAPAAGPAPAPTPANGEVVYSTLR